MRLSNEWIFEIAVGRLYIIISQHDSMEALFTLLTTQAEKENGAVFCLTVLSISLMMMFKHKNWQRRYSKEIWNVIEVITNYNHLKITLLKHFSGLAEKLIANKFPKFSNSTLVPISYLLLYMKVFSLNATNLP